MADNMHCGGLSVVVVAVATSTCVCMDTTNRIKTKTGRASLLHIILRTEVRVIRRPCLLVVEIPVVTGAPFVYRQGKGVDETDTDATCTTNLSNVTIFSPA